MNTADVVSELSQAPGDGPALARRAFALPGQSLVLAKRNLIKVRRTPAGVAHAVFIPIIFLVMFVYLFGGAVSGSSHRYLQFIFPAAMVMTVIIAGTMMTGISLNVDINKGIFDRFRSLPISRSAPLIGAVLGDIVRYLLALVSVFAFGYLLGFRVTTNVLAALAASVLVIVFGFCLSWGYVLAGVLMRDPAGVQGIVTLTLFPLAFGTDLVAPAKTMPGWLQAWVKVNPATQAMDTCRGLLTGGPVASPLARTLLWCLALLAVFASLAVAGYRRRT
jgi:oleandomycin transport system permease protein